MAIEPGGERHRGDRDGDAGKPGPVEPVDLHRQHIEQVGQGQPDRADLLPARRQAVEDATRDHEMRARVPVSERQPGAVVVNGRPESDTAPRRRRSGAGPATQRARRSEGDGLSQGF